MLPVDAYDIPIRVEWKLLAQLRCDTPTITNVELAKRLAVNANTLTRWLASPEYQRYENWILTKNFEALPLAERVAAMDVADAFTNGAAEMQDRLHRIIETVGDPKLEAELCQDWLDRAGYAPQRKVAQGQGRTVVLTGEAMEVFFRRSKEAGLLAGTTGEQSETQEGEVVPEAPAVDVVVRRASGS